MSKTPKSSFQLKPKHLIGAFFGVCIIAVAALVIGVISTIKSHDSQEREAIKNKPVPKDTPVEVWRPIGAPEEDRTKPAAKAERFQKSRHPAQKQIKRQKQQHRPD